LNRAKKAHEERSAAIDNEREAVEKRSRGEDARWKQEIGRLEKALRRARE
jgi:hypothetical protein